MNRNALLREADFYLIELPGVHRRRAAADNSEGLRTDGVYVLKGEDKFLWFTSGGILICHSGIDVSTLFRLTHVFSFSSSLPPLSPPGKCSRRLFSDPCRTSPLHSHRERKYRMLQQAESPTGHLSALLRAVHEAFQRLVLPRNCDQTWPGRVADGRHIRFRLPVRPPELHAYSEEQEHDILEQLVEE